MLSIGLAHTQDSSYPSMSKQAARNRSIWTKIAILSLFALILLGIYALWGLPTMKPALARYAISLRIPKIAAILLASVAIGAATLVFQSIINNVVVTPCLLGMNALYTLAQTVLVFAFGMGSLLASNPIANFFITLGLMAVVATFLYSYLFKKTHYNVLYVLLIGTVLTGAFGSIQSTLVRVMDPNDYDALLTQLVASFTNINVSILSVAAILLGILCIALAHELGLLDVMALGKPAAINLGVDYNKSVRRLLLGVVLAIAIATALVGSISFLGLILANVARNYVKTYKHSQLICTSIAVGITALSAAQFITERIFALTIPISVFITIAGGIYFLYLLMKPQFNNA